MARDSSAEDVRILFIEDNPLDIELCRLQLERDGLHFEWQSTASAAGVRAALRKFQPDIVICDYSMPGFNGRDALNLIHRLDAKLPIIVLSGSITEEVALECLQEGATDCLAKQTMPRLPPAVRRALNEVIARRRYEARIQRISNFDQLTGLANATLFQDRVSRAIHQAKVAGHSLAVIAFDIDGFSLLDHGFGRTASNAVLKAVGARLRSQVPPRSTVARLGNDEFAALLPHLRPGEDLEAIVRKLQDDIARPLTIQGHELRVTASAGVSTYSHEGGTPEQLIADANAALRNAKSRAYDNFERSTGNTAEIAVARLKIETGLRAALEQGGLEMHYQPQYDARTRTLRGVEALMRWTLPNGTAMSPTQFIPVAEETGLIVPLGEWALRQACSDALRWCRAGSPPLTIGVNVSMGQLNGDFCETVVEALCATGFPAGSLEIELTESTLVSDMERARDICTRLKKLGARVAIDDFGTGYSSLLYLSRLPVDRLKIDKSFVRSMSTDRQSSTIVSAVISLGHSLGMEVIAEGVETEAEFAALTAMGCDQAQGFLFSRAVPAAAIQAMLDLQGIRGHARAIRSHDAPSRYVSSPRGDPQRTN
jgi:diguanylate cyclase (GGDEF)-like protein